MCTCLQQIACQVVSQARALLCPLRRCWFLEGRAPRCLLPALLYMSWKSLDPARGKVPLEAFCKQHSMSSPTSAVRRTVTDLKRVSGRARGCRYWSRASLLLTKGVKEVHGDFLGGNSGFKFQDVVFFKRFLKGHVGKIDQELVLY